MESFKEQLKKEFDKNLSSEQMAALKTVVKKEEKKRLGSVLSLVAMIIIALVVFKIKEPSLEIKIVNEIAYNHLKNSQSTINTNNFDDINKHLKDLKFKVIPSKRLADYEILGAKYCKVQGIKAAQLKLIDTSGNKYTLYQYISPDKVKDQDWILSSKGVEVLLWEENNVYFGLAK